MSYLLRQSTATTVQFGPFVEATDGYSYKATTITFASGVVEYVWENGNVTGILVAPSLSKPGWMTVPLAISDTAQLGKFMLRCGNVTSNLPVWREHLIVPAQVYDSLVLGSDFLQVDVVQVTGSAPSNAAIGSVANLTTGVNATSIAGAAPSDAIPAGVLNYVMFTPGAQTITVKDTLKSIAAAVAGKLDGATGAAVRLYGPSGEVRVSAAVVSGNRTGVTWVTG